MVMLLNYHLSVLIPTDLCCSSALVIKDSFAVGSGVGSVQEFIIGQDAENQLL